MLVSRVCFWLLKGKGQEPCYYREKERGKRRESNREGSDCRQLFKPKDRFNTIDHQWKIIHWFRKTTTEKSITWSRLWGPMYTSQEKCHCHARRKTVRSNKKAGRSPHANVGRRTIDCWKRDASVSKNSTRSAMRKERKERTQFRNFPKKPKKRPLLKIFQPERRADGGKLSRKRRGTVW